MLFPVSGIDCCFLFPVLSAFTVAFVCSIAGISGAFLLLPLQMELGCVSPCASATCQLFNTIATPAGVLRYAREKRMVWPLAIAVALGTLPGVFLGALLRVTVFPDIKAFSLFASVVLAWIGGKLLYSLLRSKEKRLKKPPSSGAKAQVFAFSFSRIAYSFDGQDYSCSFWGVVLLSLGVGVIGGAYGIGGGAIMAPFLVSQYKLPVHTVSGATLFGTLVTSLCGVASYTVLASFFPEQSIRPDWLLGLLFGIGGIAGMSLGARFQKFVPEARIRYLLSAVIFISVFRCMKNFF